MYLIEILHKRRVGYKTEAARSVVKKIARLTRNQLQYCVGVFLLVLPEKLDW